MNIKSKHPLFLSEIFDAQSCSIDFSDPLIDKSPNFSSYAHTAAKSINNDRNFIKIIICLHDGSIEKITGKLRSEKKSGRTHDISHSPLYMQISNAANERSLFKILFRSQL